MPSSSIVTRASLLLRLNDSSSSGEAWAEFVEVYGRHVVRWCRRHGLQENEAQDVAQDVLVKFWKRSLTFEYNPERSFRSYLSVIVNSAISDYFAKYRHPKLMANVDPTQTLNTVPAREDLLVCIEASYDKELLAIAMQQVESRVHSHTWRAFHLLAIEGLSGAKVSAELGMGINTAYVARKKVQRMIRKVITELETCEEAAEP